MQNTRSYRFLSAVQIQIAAVVLLGLICLPWVSCKNYSFTGASVSPDIKTVTIPFFPNRASLVQPVLSQTFTEKMRDKFVSQTNLTLTEAHGDLLFEGYISDYHTQPVAIQGNDNAALNRLTISVFVKFINTKDPKQDFETTFSRYADFSASQNLASVEQSLISEINAQLVDDIFNKSMVNW
ncbi:MAG: LPS assembly lipoprotein LptE [Bacteroidia bacterium]|nr:LPS assembly lipoprotein LptE [Bacteroidia bacterium]